MKASPKRDLFDSMIKDLENEKSKFQTTPRKSLSFLHEEKENKYIMSHSPKIKESDKTFHVDHLKESLPLDQSSSARLSMPKRTITFNENYLSSSGTGSTRIEKPPIFKPQQTNNINKLKLKEKLKKMQITKAELSMIVKDIEIEKYKVTELKNSIFNDIRKTFDELLKKDEAKLKEDMKRCLEMISELQEWELNTEIKLEKYNSVLDEDINELEDNLKKFECLDIYRTKLASIELTLVEKEKLDEMTRMIDSAKQNELICMKEYEKYKGLYDAEVALTQQLTKKLEDCTNKNQRLEMLVEDYEEQEKEKRMLENKFEQKEETFKKEKTELENQMNYLQESSQIKLKSELERNNLKYFDQLFLINSHLKKACLNLGTDFKLENFPEKETYEFEALVGIIKTNIDTLSKTFESEIEGERQKVKNLRKSLESETSQNLEVYQKEVQSKFELEKSELKLIVEKQYLQEKQNLIKKIAELEEKLKNMISSESFNKVQSNMKDKDHENEKKLMEIRREHSTSMAVMKEQYERELSDNAEELKNYYEKLRHEDQSIIERLKEENELLNEELENANKQIFDLMKYKLDFKDAMEQERKVLETEYLEKHSVLSNEFESKLAQLEEYNARLREDHQKQLQEIQDAFFEEKKNYNSTIEGMKEGYYAKLEDLEQIHHATTQQYQEKLESFMKFRDEQQRNIKQIENNLETAHNEIQNKDSQINEKESRIKELIEKVKEIEYEFMKHQENSVNKSKIEYLGKVEEEIRARYGKPLLDLVAKIKNYLLPSRGSLSKKIKGMDIENLAKDLNTSLTHHSFCEEKSSFLDQRSFGLNESGVDLPVANTSISQRLSTITQCEPAVRSMQRSTCTTLSTRSLQTEMIDDSIFPPFDYRICLRCKHNDLSSPEYCKYANIQNLDDLSFHSNKSQITYKVSKIHIYGVNVGFKSRFPTFNSENNIQNPEFECKDVNVNTIITSNDFLQDSTYDNEEIIELKTPKAK